MDFINLEKSVIMSRKPSLALPAAIALSVLSLACNTPENERDQSDGKSLACTVVTIDDSSYAIRCPDGSEAIIKNGTPGPKGEPGEGSDSESCSIDKNADGADVITCGDKSIVIGNNCAGGFPGSLMLSGEGMERDNSALAIVSLLGCTEIQGDLSFDYISEDGLFPELQNIQHVGGSVLLSHSYGLQKIELQNLKSIGKDLIVADHQGLTELSFPALESIGGSLTISNTPNNWPSGPNPMLEKISFPELTAIEQDLIIHSTESLTSLDGLSSLRTIGRDVLIESNTSLESLDGIKGLTHVEGNVVIRQNNALDICAAVAQFESLPGFDPAERLDDKLITDLNESSIVCP